MTSSLITNLMSFVQGNSTLRRENNDLDVHSIFDNLLATSLPLNNDNKKKNYSHFASFIDSLKRPTLILSLVDANAVNAASLDPRTLTLMRHQVLSQSFAMPPTLSTLLNTCYILSAWLCEDPTATTKSTNLAIVGCTNGKTRTALAVAAYAKYSGRVATMRQGFVDFLHVLNLSTSIVDELPPSILLLFTNFDRLVDTRQFYNNKPLWLRAVALQGIPVEDKPTIELMDAQGKVLYKSSEDSSSSQWAEEEGFYVVNTVLEGDFCLLCRFGGGDDHDNNDDDDSSRVIFRYVNTVGFLGNGIYELPASRVDLMRRYAHFFDDDFLLSLVFESYWSRSYEGENDEEDLLSEILCEPSTVLPQVLWRADALEEGWRLITELHAVQPTDADIDRFYALIAVGDDGFLKDCPRHYVSLALQLHDMNVKAVREELTNGLLGRWWQHDRDDQPKIDDDEYYEELQEASAEARRQRETAKRQRLLDILDGADVYSNLSEEERARIGSFESSSSSPSGCPTAENAPSDSSRCFDGGDQQELTLADFYVSPLMAPHVGDMMNILRPDLPPNYLFEGRGQKQTPSFPLVPKDGFSISSPMPMELPQNSDAAELLLQMDNPSVILQDLLDLQQAARSWNEQETENGESTQESSSDKPRKYSMIHHELPLQKQQGETVSAEQTDAVEHREADTGKIEPTLATHDSSASHDGEAALKDDPKFEKYFRMLSKGIPDGAVRNALVRDGHDPSILDLDPERSLLGQTTRVAQEDHDAPLLKDDPKFEKYFRMLSKGIPDGAVRNALVRDGHDPSILDLDPNKCLASQLKETVEEEQPGGEPKLRDDPKFEKYFRMKDKGIPDGAVRNALKRDGHDPSILDLDPDKPLSSQLGGGKENVGEPVLKDDPKFEKYFRMREKGLPDGAVRNAMMRDGLDPSILDLDPNQPLGTQLGGGGGGAGKEDVGECVLKDDPKFEKYFRMREKGLPDGAVRNAMMRDGLDPSILDLDPNKSFSSQTKQAQKGDDEPVLMADPRFEKYFRMKEKGLPDGAVRNALSRDGHDPSILDLDPNKSLASQMQSKEKKDNAGIPLREDPEFKKYFSMLKMGIPVGGVRNAMQKDGKDPSVLDMDPNKSLDSQISAARRHRQGSMIKKKKRVRRKKIFWTPIDPNQIKEDSLWSLVQGKALTMSKLNYDQKEFEDLFTESAEPTEKQRRKATTNASKPKKSVQVIDGKRSMNGGIILLRLKMDCKVIAQMVDKMEHGGLDSTQLKALKEFLPTVEEREGLLSYMKSHSTSEESRRSAYADLSECEKYMLAMIDVEEAAEKFDCLLFRAQFRGRLDELVDSIRVVERACDEVRHSEKLREIMALILTLVNEINTGGDGNEAIGFSLDALLKLNEAKAFDRKTSVLQYLVKLVKANDADLCDFRGDLRSVSEAETVILDSLVAEIQNLKHELVPVLATVRNQADHLEETGQIQKTSLSELREQRTSIRNIERVPQYNQIDHLTGRTSMERFALSATNALLNATRLAEDVKSKYMKLLEYLCEDENMASNDFFGTMRRFMDEFDRSLEAVEREEKAKKRELARMAKKSPVSSPPPGLRPDRSQLADLASLAAMKASRMGSQETGNSESGEADDAEESTTNARQSSLHTNTGKSLAEIRTEEERNAVGEDGRKEQPHGSAESSMPGVEATDGAEGNNILNRSDDRWENLPSAGGTPTRQGTVSTSEALDEADDEFSSPGIR